MNKTIQDADETTLEQHIIDKMEADEKTHYKVKWKEENSLIQNRINNAKKASFWVRTTGFLVVLQLLGTFVIKIWKCVQVQRRVAHARRVKAYWQDALKKPGEEEGMVSADLDVVGGMVDMETADDEIRMAKAELGDEMLSVMNSVIRLVVFSFISRILRKETKMVTPPSPLLWQVAVRMRNGDFVDAKHTMKKVTQKTITFPRTPEQIEATKAWTEVIVNRLDKSEESIVLLQDEDIDNLFQKANVRDILQVWNEKVTLLHDSSVMNSYVMFPAVQQGKNLERSFVEWLAVFMGLLI